MKKNPSKILLDSTQTEVNFQTKTKSKTQTNDSNSVLLYQAVAIALLTLTIYLPSLKNDFVVGWDDASYITQNEHIRALDWKFFRWALFDTKVAMYWHPLTWISHALDYKLWGLNPLGHHLSSIILHAINAGIVFWLVNSLLTVTNDCRLASGKTIIHDRQNRLITAGITGLLFGVHPLHVESVAWVAQRKDLLYSLFYLLSINSYIRYASRLAPLKVFYNNYRYYNALVFFILSLCSKPMAVTLPIILLLLDYYPLKRITSWKNLSAIALEKIPFIVPSIVVSVISVVGQKATTLIQLEPITTTTRLLVVCRGLILYLWQIVVPINLLPLYIYPRDAALTKPIYPLSIFIVLVITTTCLLLKNNQPLWLAVWGYFIITVSPVLGFFQHTGAQNMANRYMYLPCCGLFLIFSLGVALIWNYASTMVGKEGWLRLFLATVLILIFISLTTLTLKQIGIWQNTITLLSYYIKKVPRSFPDAYYIRGGAFRDNKQLDLAINDFSTAISIFPNFTFAYLERGETYRDCRQPDKAINDFNAAIAIDPNYTMAYVDRAEVLLENGHYDQSIKDSSRAIALNPDSTDAYINRGTAYFLKNEIPLAFDDYNKAIAKKPTSIKAYLSRGFVYSYIGQSDNAIKDYSIALSFNNDLVDIYVRRGDLYMKVGSLDRAASDYQKACNMGNQPACSKQLMAFPKNLKR